MKNNSVIIIATLLLISTFFSFNSFAGEKTKGEESLNQGVILFHKSNYEGSLKLLNESLSLFTRSGDKRGQAKAELQLARLYLETGDPDQAISYSVACFKKFDKLRDQQGKFEADTVSAKAYLFRNDLDKAGEKIANAWSLINKDFPEDIPAEFYIARGIYEQRKKRTELSVKNFNEAYLLGIKTGDLNLQIMALNELALSYSRNNNIGAAKKYYQQGLELISKTDRKYFQALYNDTDGWINWAQGNKEDVTSCWLKSLAQYRSMENKGMEINTLLNLAWISNTMQAPEKSHEFILKAIELSKLEKNDFLRLTSVWYLKSYISSFRKADDTDLACKEYEEMGRTFKDLSYRAQAYFNLGEICQFIRRDYKEAELNYSNAERCFKESGDKKEQIHSMLDTSTVQAIQGKYEESLESCKKALNIREKMGEVRKEDDPLFYRQGSIGEIYRRIGHTCRAKSDYTKALQYYHKALDYDSSKDMINEKISDLNFMMETSLEIYDLDGSWKALERLIKEIPRLDNPVQRLNYYSWIFRGLTNRSSKEKTSGSTPQSLLLKKLQEDQELNQKVLISYKESLEQLKTKKLHPGFEINLCKFLGEIHTANSKFIEAANEFEKAAELAHKLGDVREEADSCDLLADLMMTQGKMNEAVDYGKKALKVMEEGKDVPGRFNALKKLGYLYLLNNDYNSSLDYYTRAEKVAGMKSDMHDMFPCLAGKGLALYDLNRYRDSLENWQKALKYAKQSKNIQSEADCYVNIAGNNNQLGRLKDALLYYNKALDVYTALSDLDSMRDISLEMGSIYEKQGNEAEALSLYLKAVTHYVEAWKNIPPELGRIKFTKDSPLSRLFEKTITLLIKTGRDKEALKYLEISRSLDVISGLNLEKINVKNEKLTSLTEKIKEIQKEMEMAHNELERTKDSKRKEVLTGVLASNRKEFFLKLNEIKSENPDFEKLFTVRSSDLAILQKTIPDESVLVEYFPAVDSLFIFVITNNSFNIRSVGIGRQRLYQIVTALRDEISKPGRRELTDNYYKNRTLLYSFLLAPLKNDLENKKSLVLAPGGLLHYLPFEVLGEEKNSYIIDKLRVSYLSSGDVIRMAKYDANDTKFEGKDLLAMSAPEEVNLPRTNEEVIEIAKLYPDCRIFTGKDSTREHFLEEAPNSLIIHLATHSSLDSKDINKSFIQFSGKDDRLTLGDIYGLSLREGSMAVLSSCESAMGEENPGREFASLASAFGTAGASTVIASLWQVDDKATADLFTEFYRNLNSGKNRSEALKAAKIKIMNNPETSSPFFWAGFILMGRE